MNGLRDERGLTLIELQIVLVLMIVVLGATLTTFNRSEANWRVNQEQTDAQDQNRRAIDTIARQLRNLASPSLASPAAVERAGAQDLVFQTVAATKPDGSQNDRNITRVRYCLGASSGGKATLLRQEQTWTTPNPPAAMPVGTSCPAAGWPAIAGAGVSARTVADNLVNREHGEPIFTYDSTDLDSIYSIGVELLVDVDPSASPAVSRLASGVFLRNQNQAPIASATATATGTGHLLLLNGSASSDPEGSALAAYTWFADGAMTEADCEQDDPIGTGPVVQWKPPGSTWPQTVDVTLCVTDVGGRIGIATLDGVTVN
jgi:type II secretory pathway pseudopilin PulG